MKTWLPLFLSLRTSLYNVFMLYCKHWIFLRILVKVNYFASQIQQLFNNHHWNRDLFFPQPRQNGRYSRVPSQGGGSGTHNVFSPEYDDPANCAPEEDQYGSQYGQYGAPYDHYGSRGSVGRRSVGSARNLPISGSPEPPPPPPRNHQDQNNSSFNDSKESNEISEAECDRDQLVNRNYGGQ